MEPTPGHDLPAGLTVGEEVFFTGPNTLITSGLIEHSVRGRVTGHTANEKLKGQGVAVLFPGHASSVDCVLRVLSRAAPAALPNGLKPSERLYWTGPSETFPSGNKVEYGALGTVVGPSPGPPRRSAAVNVLFPGNKAGLSCFIHMLSREEPPPLEQGLPGGLKLGEELFYAGPSYTIGPVLPGYAISHTGVQIEYGAKVKVVGPTSLPRNAHTVVNVLYPGVAS